MQRGRRAKEVPWNTERVRLEAPLVRLKNSQRGSCVRPKAGFVTQVRAPRERSAALHREMTWSKGGGSEIDRSHKPLVPVSARSSCINRQTFSGLGKHLKFQTDLGDGRAIGGTRAFSVLAVVRKETRG